MKRLVFLFLVLTGLMWAQDNIYPSYRDTTIKVYEPVFYRDTLRLRNFWGVNILVLNVGYGLGLYVGRELNFNFSAGLKTYFSYVKDEQEIEYYDMITGEYYTPGKVNRIFALPVFAIFEYHLFRQHLTDNFRISPFVGAGVGFIFTTPYEIDFFRSFKYLRVFYEPAASIGINARFGLTKKTFQGICLHYYHIFNKNNIASLAGKPMANLGGWAIVITMGYRF